MVGEREIIEPRRTSTDAKLHQLAALTVLRGLFRPDPEREHGVQLVRERWALLRQVLGG